MSDALCEGIEFLDPFLVERRTLNLFIDLGLVLRGVAGWRSLLPEAPACIGCPLVELLPEMAAHLAELEALAAGRVESLDLGLIRLEREGRTLFVTSQVFARVRDGAAVGFVQTLQEATRVGERLDRLEKVRRELFGLRQTLARANMELAIAQSEVRRLDSAKSQFVSAAAHELRNPLASLIGFIDLLSLEAAENLSPAQREILAGLGRSAKRLAVLTNNLLDVSRIDSNRLELVMAEVDSLDLVEQVVGDMQPLFDLKKQLVVLRAEPSLPRIWCDRDRAAQILTNLLSNAHKYTPPGGTVTVAVGRQRQRPFVLIRVRDTGIGIPPEDQDHLFNRFYRASNAGTADGGGAGLGLAITQSLVTLHGGKIWLESNLGRGTTFFVTFPVVG